MEQICAILWLLITGLSVYIPAGVTWLLGNIPWFANWWTLLANWKKYAILSLFTLIVGIGALLLGLLALHCAGWPEWTAILYVILVAVAGYWNSGKRYEQTRRKTAESAVQRQAQQILELQQKNSVLGKRLDQLQRK